MYKKNIKRKEENNAAMYTNIFADIIKSNTMYKVLESQLLENIDPEINIWVW